MKLPNIILLFFITVTLKSFSQTVIQINRKIDQGSFQSWEVSCEIHIKNKYFKNRYDFGYEAELKNFKINAYYFKGKRYSSNDLLVENVSTKFPNGIKFPIKNINHIYNRGKTDWFFSCEGNMKTKNYITGVLFTNTESKVMTGSALNTEQLYKYISSLDPEYKLNDKEEDLILKEKFYDDKTVKVQFEKFLVQGLSFSNTHLGNELQNIIRSKGSYSKNDKSNKSLKKKTSKNLSSKKDRKPNSQEHYDNVMTLTKSQINSVKRQSEVYGNTINKVTNSIGNAIQKNYERKETSRKKKLQERERAIQEWNNFLKEQENNESKMSLEELENKIFATFSSWNAEKLSKFSLLMPKMKVLFLVNYKSSYIPKEITNLKNLTSLLIERK